MTLELEHTPIEVKVGGEVHPEPSVSVIVPNYNTADYIAETLDSVFAQTFCSFEVIVINDGSPDTEQLRRVLAPYYDRIVFIEKERNEGTSATRNLAVRSSRAPIIAFLDADDVWMPTFLEELYEFITEGDYQMAYADAESYVSGGRGPSTDFRRLNPPQGLVTRRMLVEGRCLILPSGTLIRKDIFESIGGFDPSVRRTEDFDLWMRLAFAGTRIGHLRKILFRFRVSPGSGSGDSITRHERNVVQWRLLQKKLKFTEEEKVWVETHIKCEEANVTRAKGHFYIERGEWSAARQMFIDAKQAATELKLPFAHKVKLTLVLILLRLWPSALRFAFRRLRGHEIAFMPKDGA